MVLEAKNERKERKRNEGCGKTLCLGLWWGRVVRWAREFGCRGPVFVLALVGKY